MKSQLAPVQLRSPTSRIEPVASPARAAAAECGRLWAEGAIPSPERLWAAYSPEGSVEVLSAILKVDLHARFSRGERPGVAEYLDRFAPLRSARDRVVSLVYEEYCLREESGEHLDADSFCARYDPWRDSLLSQLRYHQVLSQAMGIEPGTRSLLAPGERFRSFLLRSVLGRGGSATVYLAYDETLGNRSVALKLSTDRGREPAIQGRLDHAHIVPVLSVTDDPETGLRGLAMPYRAGLPLDEVIRRIDPASRPKSAGVLRAILNGVADAEEGDESNDESAARWRGFPDRGTYAQGVAWVVSVVARALAYAHGKGVLHRDVKPANVLLTSREGPQLLDFNLSHSPHAADRAEAALRGGTLPYMAPEQLAAFLDPEGWNTVGEAADIYAVGLLLRELLTGRRPESPDPSTPLPRAIGELLDRRASGFGSARGLNPDIPHGLDAILARCLANRPEDRYSGAKALAEDLQRFVERRPLVEASNPSRVERLRDGASRRRIAIASVFIVLVAVGCLMASTLLSARDGRYEAGRYVGIARDYFRKKAFDDTIAEAEKALKLDPNLYTAYWVRADALQAQGRTAQALADLNKALQIADGPKASVNPADMAALLLDKAKIAHRHGQLAVAEAAYDRALQFNPNCPPALAAKAVFSYERGDYAKAVLFMNRAIDFWKDAKDRPGDYAPTLATYRGQRALGLACEGGQRQAGGTPEDFLRAKPLYEAAWKDIEAARNLDARLSSVEAARLDFAESRVRMALGDLASQPNDDAGALKQYEAALNLLHATDGKINADLIRRHERELDMRIKDAKSKLGL